MPRKPPSKITKGRQEWPNPNKGGDNYQPSKQAKKNKLLEDRPRFRPDNVEFDSRVPGWLTIAETKEKFCRKLRRYASIHRARVTTGLSTYMLTKWREEDVEFERRIAAAWEACVDRLEGAMMGRAIDGYEEPVYQGGEMVGTRIKHDPAVQIFMLKANRPQKYGDRVTVNVAADEYAAQVRDALAAQDEEARRVAEGHK